MITPITITSNGNTEFLVPRGSYTFTVRGSFGGGAVNLFRLIGSEAIPIRGGEELTEPLVQHMQIATSQLRVTVSGATSPSIVVSFDPAG